MFFSIKSKIFLAHLFLVVILLGSLSYKHYVNVLDNYVNNIITYYTNSSSSIVRTSSLAISGSNYGNIQLPSFIEEVSQNKKLLYLNITGVSDYSSKNFNAVYDKNHKTIYRNEYPIDYAEQLNNKLKRFTVRLNDTSSDKVKLNFLIERTKDKLNQYKQNINYTKELKHRYLSILSQKFPYIDYEQNLLYLSLPTYNKNGGAVSMIFDISELTDIKSNTLKDLLLEVLVALFIAIIILNIISNKIIGPLNKLSYFMSNDFQNINTNNTPGLELKNEIGILSRSFKTLLQTLQEKQVQTEHKAYVDGLTGVYNRNKFLEVFTEELKRIQRYPNKFSIAIIDIDDFKNFNDTYGHLIGDEILIMMAQSVNNNIRSTDMFFRWGGEEFVVLFTETSAEEAIVVSKKLKAQIQGLEHQTAQKITASFGITQYIEGDTLKSMFERCDNALYMAKRNGKNRIEFL